MRRHAAQRPSDRLGLDCTILGSCWWLAALVACWSAARGGSFGIVNKLIDPSPNSRRHPSTWRKSCRPSKPSLQMPSSRARHRQPSCCCQPQAGSRRFDISESRYPEPGRMMAALGQWSLPSQPRMRGQRMRRWQPSPGGFSSWCSPIVMRSTSNGGKMESADEGSCTNEFVLGAPIDIDQ